MAALAYLDLDEVWWLVSPQNPLMPADGMASFADRMASARAMAHHPRIHAADIEQRLGTRYTANTMRKLVIRFPPCRFVWLMGADNLAWHEHPVETKCQSQTAREHPLPVKKNRP